MQAVDKGILNIRMTTETLNHEINKKIVFRYNSCLAEVRLHDQVMYTAY